jgi:hypothetical protein
MQPSWMMMLATIVDLSEVSKRDLLDEFEHRMPN